MAYEVLRIGSAKRADVAAMGPPERNSSFAPSKTRLGFALNEREQLERDERRAAIIMAEKAKREGTTPAARAWVPPGPSKADVDKAALKARAEERARVRAVFASEHSKGASACAPRCSAHPTAGRLSRSSARCRR